MENPRIRGLYGGLLKVTEGDLDSDTVTVSGPAVVFSKGKNPKKDLHGEYFTKDTYLGKLKGNGVDAMFHHGIPLLYKGWSNEHYLIEDDAYDFSEGLALHNFENPIKTELTGEALVASLVLEMRKDYEKWVAERAQKGLLGWSSGSTWHMTDIDWETGEIKRWPIAEISLTPTPAEPRTSAGIKGIKSFQPDSYTDFLVKCGMITRKSTENKDSGTSNSDFCQSEEMSLTDYLDVKIQLQRLEEFSLV